MAILAVVMGLPTLRGTFVGGDDYRLVLNHVLVNHPSWAHALELFGIIHRDLYQPLPLLSFSAEFAVAGKLGLLDQGIDAGAWLFHLTNILLHAVNAVLVWAVIRALHGPLDRQSGNVVAFVAGVGFAVHPLQVEVVAWINGRMMLLSTLFALLSLLSLDRWFRAKRLLWAGVLLLCVTCCMISKVRVELPWLLLIVPLSRRLRLDAKFVAVWIASAVITAVFTAVNIHATEEAGMFEGAARNLHGSHVARALLSLSWYFQHFVWPSRLASWYPAPGMVRWSDGATLWALAIMLPVFTLVIGASLKSRHGALAFAWFFLAVASTVQLVPTRNTLAADRYMYLPIIGLLWVTGWALHRAYQPLARRLGTSALQVAAIGGGGLLAVVLIAMSWHVASYYDTQITKSMRIAELFPDTPHVWERAAWAYQREGLYDQAIVAAQRELKHDDNNARSDAFEVIGAAQLANKQYEAAMTSFEQAIKLDPKSPAPKYRLATELEELGRKEDALSLFQQAVAMAPLKNPWLLRLGALYQALGRPDDARSVYQQALQNNPYEVPATLAMAELDMAIGTPDAYGAAERRLLALLDWMPENHAARINLGVVYHASGKLSEATHVYRMVLKSDPSNITASLNLAAIMVETGEIGEAWSLYEHAVATGSASMEQLLAVHDFFIEQGASERAVALWTHDLRLPVDRDILAMRAWSRAIAGDVVGGKADLALIADGEPSPAMYAVQAYLALSRADYELAVDRVDSLIAAGTAGLGMRTRLLRALEQFDLQRPDNPWTYCLTAALVLADGKLDAAKVFAKLCEQRCGEQKCGEYLRKLHSQLPPDSASYSGEGNR